MRSLCSYDFYDIYMSQYVSDFKNWDLAIITLKEPVGLKAGWMGIKALPPKGACTPGSTSLPRLHSVGYPVESVSSAFQYTSTCSLEVRLCCLGCAGMHSAASDSLRLQVIYCFLLLLLWQHGW